MGVQQRVRKVKWKPTDGETKAEPRLPPVVRCELQGDAASPEVDLAPYIGVVGRHVERLLPAIAIHHLKFGPIEHLSEAAN